MKVREVRGGDASQCSGLWNGRYSTVTYVYSEGVCLDGWEFSWLADIELALEPSWDNLQVGMEIENEYGVTAEILEVGASGKTLLPSLNNNRTYADRWFTATELQKFGWKIKGSSPAPEVIEISGKKYDKTQVEERIKELKPL